MPCRFCCQKRGGLLPRRFTIAVLIAETWADYSLWHFPSPRGVRPLTGILLCGARTFLCASELRSDCPASFRVDYRIGKPGSPDFSCGVTLDPLRGQKPAFTATARDLPYRRLMRDVVLCASELCIDYPAGFSTNVRHPCQSATRLTPLPSRPCAIGASIGPL